MQQFGASMFYIDRN